MDWFLLTLTAIVVIIGVLGSFLPVLPGPPLCFAGMIIIEFTRFADFETSTLVIFGLVTISVAILDYFVPIWGTKKYGGSKYGVWGSIVGLIAGMFFLPLIGPFGIVTILGGPFLGAYIGEIINKTEGKKALRAAFGTFIGFLAGTFMKLALSIIIAVFITKEIISTSF